MKNDHGFSRTAAASECFTFHFTGNRRGILPTVGSFRAFRCRINPRIALTTQLRTVQINCNAYFVGDQNLADLLASIENAASITCSTSNGARKCSRNGYIRLDTIQYPRDRRTQSLHHSFNCGSCLHVCHLVGGRGGVLISASFKF